MIELRRLDNVVVLSLNAGKANALDPALLEALTETLDTLSSDWPGALVITGEGSMFSGGLALPVLIDYDRAAMKSLMTTFAHAMRSVLELPIPTVAALNGNAIAGGCVLALMCDERVMIAQGPKGPPRIGLNEAQLGLGLPSVVLEVLRHRVPPTSLTKLALAGALVEPVEAETLGLVDEVVAPESFQAHVLERAANLAASAPLAYAQIKEALLRPVVQAIEARWAADADAWLDTWFSDEGQRRLRAALARITKT